MRHINNMAKIMLATGLIVTYGYLMEGLHGLVRRQPVRDLTDARDRALGDYPHLVAADPLQLHHRPALLVPVTSARTSTGSGSSRSSSTSACGLSDTSSSSPACTADFLPSSWGIVPRNVLGLRDLLRDDRPVPDPDLPLHPGPAGDLDHRDAGAGARDPVTSMPRGTAPPHTLSRASREGRTHEQPHRERPRHPDRTGRHH